MRVAERCVWRFVASVPVQLIELLKDPAKQERVMDAFMQMKKIDIAKLEEV
ncbi:hypothetical protein SHA02_11060 [Salisediminibacterium halotolerans]|nr:hypothetical protein SHA02_11060 [Salisediminibacterium halotolerans]